MKHIILTILFAMSAYQPFAQMTNKTVSIKQFGAKGDGKTNDQEAFEKASDYINMQKQNVTLIIPYGLYIIGKQTHSGEWLLSGSNGLNIEKCKNITVKGEIKNGKYPKIKYMNGLYFGSFVREGNNKYKPNKTNTRDYYDKSASAFIGTCVNITQSENVQISNLEIDGNQAGMIIGGMFGDVGHQLSHRGIYLVSSKNTKINDVYVHHLALDGISILGATNTTIINLESTYNGRQGLSWVDGNVLTAKNCKFSHTGFSRISSSPCSGVDIESEEGHEIRSGLFENCEFINNKGYGMIADSGPSSDMTFSKCTFWGVSNWSAWVRKPNYTFNNCNFYGSFVHGYVTTSQEEATKFYNCNFEDKAYEGKKPFGAYLVECDGKKMMVFDNCTFTAHDKKVIWFNGAAATDGQKAIFKNCTINLKTNNFAAGSFWGVMRRMKIQNMKVNSYAPKEKKYYLAAENNVVEGVETKYLIK